jgi:hypothetical protein
MELGTWNFHSKVLRSFRQKVILSMISSKVIGHYDHTLQVCAPQVKAATMATASEYLLEILQGETGSTFKVLATGWDDSTDGEF